jgi:hypothetical protein
MYEFAGEFGSVGAYGEPGEKALLQRMAATTVRYGPDDAEYWCAVDQWIGSGHQRASIVGRLERIGV